MDLTKTDAATTMVSYEVVVWDMHGIHQPANGDRRGFTGGSADTPADALARAGRLERLRDGRRLALEQTCWRLLPAGYLPDVRSVVEVEPTPGTWTVG